MAVSPPPPRADVERQVLEIVAGLVGELGQGAAPPPALDDSLDRDLRDAARDETARSAGEPSGALRGATS